MGRHTEWRRIAKRERRRKIRKQVAQQRDSIYDDEEYLKELNILEEMEIEKIEIQNNEENDKWLQAEQLAIKQWNKLQERLKLLQQEKLAQEARMKVEWEVEQEKLKKEAERLKAIEEENKLRHETFIKNLEEFLSGNATEPPTELVVLKETRINAEPCPFFTKTACCRFGDQCSRNHQYPGISRTLLATNFYTHFGLNNSTQNEYDTDIMLEYEDSETYKEYKEFFYDVLKEFEKFGKIIQFKVSKMFCEKNIVGMIAEFHRESCLKEGLEKLAAISDEVSKNLLKVCNNYEKHLRGNTYVEFAELRCAVAAYRALHSRWYGGRQLSLQFCLINSWKNAICGLHFKKRCPKGRACNFLHVFRNPNNLFSGYNVYQRERQESERSKREKTPPPRSWRWSESPEVEIPKRSPKRRSRSRSPKRRSRSRSPRRRDKQDRRRDERRHRSSRRSKERK